MAKDDISSLEFDEVAERLVTSEIGEMLRTHYAVQHDELNEGDNDEFCEFCPW